MEAREIMARRAPSLEERINALRDKGVVIGGIMVLASIFLIAADGNRKAKAPQPPEKKKATV